MTIIDISRPIDSTLGTWPGDAATEFHRTFAIERGDSVNVGQVSLSVHTGTHCDAPRHFDDSAIAAEALPLESFIGPCRVFDVRGCDPIRMDDLKIEDSAADLPQRILFRTDGWTNSTAFPKQIPIITTAVADWMGSKNVTLIGVDLPSVDRLDDAELPIHFALQKYGIHILEGLDLTRVEAGLHELIALPLPIVGSDGSPVRAVLRPIE